MGAAAGATALASTQGQIMTTPFERTRALLETKAFLLKLVDKKRRPPVPKSVREHAQYLLLHYPSYSDIELAHQALPMIFGPEPLYWRLVNGEQT